VCGLYKNWIIIVVIWKKNGLWSIVCNCNFHFVAVISYPLLDCTTETVLCILLVSLNLPYSVHITAVLQFSSVFGDRKDIQSVKNVLQQFSRAWGPSLTKGLIHRHCHKIYGFSSLLSDDCKCKCENCLKVTLRSSVNQTPGVSSPVKQSEGNNVITMVLIRLIITDTTTLFMVLSKLQHNCYD